MNTTEDRYQAILRVVAARGRVTIAELTRQLKVSEMTIRRDLAALDAEGAIRRVRGGALPVASGSYEPPFRRAGRSPDTENTASVTTIAARSSRAAVVATAATSPCEVTRTRTPGQRAKGRARVDERG